MYKILIYSCLFLLSSFSVLGQMGPVYEQEAVVCAHPEAAKAGSEVLKAGGNAVDAAFAIHFALAVVYPNAGNIGGGGFMVFRSHKREYATLDFREKAPGKATETMFLDKNGQVIPELSTYSRLASGVPGSVAGLFEALKKYGTKPAAELLKPAIELAEKGFRITQRQANEMNELRLRFSKLNPDNSYLRKTSGWKAGDTLIQKDLAETLKNIALKGRDGFYKGRTAGLIVQEMKNGGGIISRADLRKYKPVWRTPIIADWKEYKVITMPPPSSGGIALLQLLHLLSDIPLATYGFQSPEAVFYMAEAEKLVYADRAEYSGDPDFTEVPVDKLISVPYLNDRKAEIFPFAATPSEFIKPGGLNAATMRENTTHFSVIDKFGNAVSLTTTLNDSYGSGVFVNGAGFLLNNEMDDFSIKPMHPNMYGLVGKKANAIEPGKRMLSSMTPTILEKNGKLFMVVGTPGGSTIITSVFQTILNVTEFGMTMKEAVDAHRFHHQWLPDTLQYEKDTFDKETEDRLQRMGYALKVRSPIGRVDALRITPEGKIEAAPDRRGDDAAAGN